MRAAFLNSNLIPLWSFTKPEYDVINSVAIISIGISVITAKGDLETQLATYGVTQTTVELLQTDIRGHVFSIQCEYSARNQTIMRNLFGTINTRRSDV